MRPPLLISALALALVAVAGCSGSGAPTRTAQSSQPAQASTGPAASTAPPASTLVYVPLQRVFAPKDVACNQAGNTPEMAVCFEDATTASDKVVDALQKSLFDAAADDTARQAVLDEDAAWVAARVATCDKTANSGGSIDQINLRACFAAESKKRRVALEAKTRGGTAGGTASSAPVQTLRLGGTHTTPDGTTITTEGESLDPSSSTTFMVTWRVTAGPAGFALNPDDFVLGSVQKFVTGTGSRVAAGTSLPAGTTRTFTITYQSSGAKYDSLYAPGGKVEADWDTPTGG